MVQQSIIRRPGKYSTGCKSSKFEDKIDDRNSCLYVCPKKDLPKKIVHPTLE